MKTKEEFRVSSGCSSPIEFKTPIDIFVSPSLVEEKIIRFAKNSGNCNAFNSMSKIEILSWVTEPY